MFGTKYVKYFKEKEIEGKTREKGSKVGCRVDKIAGVISCYNIRNIRSHKKSFEKVVSN